MLIRDMKRENPIDKALKDPFEVKVQAYASRIIQVSHLLDWMTEKAGNKLKVYHSTFSISEEFIRNIIALKGRKNIEHYKLVIDRKALLKILHLKKFISSAVDEAVLADNHSKIIIVEGSHGKLLAVTSQNLTRGNRTESTIVTSELSAVDEMLKAYHELTASGVNINCDK